MNIEEAKHRVENATREAELFKHFFNIKNEKMQQICAKRVCANLAPMSVETIKLVKDL